MLCLCLRSRQFHDLRIKAAELPESPSDQLELGSFLIPAESQQNLDLLSSHSTSLACPLSSLLPIPVLEQSFPPHRILASHPQVSAGLRTLRGTKITAHLRKAAGDACGGPRELTKPQDKPKMLLSSNGGDQGHCGDTASQQLFTTPACVIFQRRQNTIWDQS